MVKPHCSNFRIITVHVILGYPNFWIFATLIGENGAGNQSDCFQSNHVVVPCLYLCSSIRYIVHLYCFAVQASFYGDAIECLLHKWRVTGSILSWDKCD